MKEKLTKLQKYSEDRFNKIQELSKFIYNDEYALNKLNYSKDYSFIKNKKSNEILSLISEIENIDKLKSELISNLLLNPTNKNLCDIIGSSEEIPDEINIAKYCAKLILKNPDKKSLIFLIEFSSLVGTYEFIKYSKQAEKEILKFDLNIDDITILLISCSDKSFKFYVPILETLNPTNEQIDNILCLYKDRHGMSIFNDLTRYLTNIKIIDYLDVCYPYVIYIKSFIKNVKEKLKNNNLSKNELIDIVLFFEKLENLEQHDSYFKIYKKVKKKLVNYF